MSPKTRSCHFIALTLLVRGRSSGQPVQQYYYYQVNDKKTYQVCSTNLYLSRRSFYSFVARTYILIHVLFSFCSSKNQDIRISTVDVKYRTNWTSSAWNTETPFIRNTRHTAVVSLPAGWNGGQYDILNNSTSTTLYNMLHITRTCDKTNTPSDKSPS